MNNDLYKMLFGSIVRHSLTALSAYLVAQNLLAPEHAASFTSNFVTFALDAAPGVLALLSSLAQKFDHHEALKY